MRTINIFYSWQSDNKKSRNFLSKVMTNLESDWESYKQDYNLKDFKIKYHDATRDEAGSPSIIDSIMKKINECDIFISDLSIVGNLNNKKIINNNVCFETGYAFKSLGTSKIILLVDTESGDVNDLPFDLKSYRISKFNSKTGNIGQLGKNLCEYIKTIIQKNYVVDVQPLKNDVIRSFNNLLDYIRQINENNNLQKCSESLRGTINKILEMSKEDKENKKINDNVYNNILNCLENIRLNVINNGNYYINQLENGCKMYISVSDYERLDHLLKLFKEQSEVIKPFMAIPRTEKPKF